MKVVIAKVDEIYFEGEAHSLTAPGSEGELTVLTHHMPLITVLKPGTITVRSEDIAGGQQSFAIAGGVLEVTPDSATVIL